MDERKIKNALDEARILVLGSQVLIGFQYRAVFEPGFERLPGDSRYLVLVVLGLLLCVLALLMSPSPFHQIVERGEDTERVHRFTTAVMAVALLPFAAGLGLDIYLASRRLLDRPAALAAGAATAALALGMWYFLEAAVKTRRRPGPPESPGRRAPTAIGQKIQQVLTEARVVLPGAQALLGFQFVTMLMDAFEHLPATSKLVHLASLGLTTLTVVLLMAPAAYHRIVAGGEDTEAVHRFTSRMVLSAMVPLGLSLAGDLYVVVFKVTTSMPLAVAAPVAALVVCYGFWFGVTLWVRTADDLTRR